MPPAVAVLAAVVQPENSQRQHAVYHRRRLRRAYADYGLGGGSAQQAATHISRTEAVLQIHCRAQAVHFGTDEMAGEHALQQPLIVAAGGLARGGCAAVARGNQFQRLRLGRAHAPRGQAQALRALCDLNDGADQVALLAPQFEKAAPMLLAHRVARHAHIEEHTAILEQRRRRMVGQVLFDCLGQPRGRGSLSASGHRLYQPWRVRRPVMCAVWWRECQS